MTTTRAAPPTASPGAPSGRPAGGGAPSGAARALWRPVPALVGFLAAWVALFSWSGMITQPSGFLLPVGVAGLACALAGSALRLRLPSYAVVALQVVVGVVVLNLFFAAGRSLGGVVPTGSSLSRLALLVQDGARALNYYSAPVESFASSTQALLATCGLLVVVAVDLLALGLRRPPLAALPLLVALGVPVTILLADLALPVLVVCGLLLVRLLAVEGHGRGQVWQVAAGAVALALLLAPLVPVSDPVLEDGAGLGPGTGRGDIRLNTTVNPFINMRRELIEQTATPMVYARTEARGTSYLRTTVLDRFTGEQWRPSPRDLPRDNIADGVLPSPPGLDPGAEGPEADWELQLAPTFRTTWLPLPYPLREVDADGSWRYDSTTFDVASITGGAIPGLRYTARSFAPRVTAAGLADARRPPASVREEGTALPEDLPPVIAQTAREVTRGAAPGFEEAVALQEWFRGSGGFTYSLEQRDGSGMDLLADFVTDDRIGYCEQFASAMATMARTLGIPARVAVGFLAPEEQPDGRLLYTSDARHAWPELYFSGAGWVRFEPTPGGRTGPTPDYTRQSLDRPTTAPTPTDPAAPEAATEPENAPEESGGAGGGRSSLWWALLVPLALAGAAAGPGAWRRRQRERRLGATDETAAAEGAWAELRAVVLDAGREWPATSTARQQARRVVAQAHRPSDEDVRALEALLVEVERVRYAGLCGGVLQTAAARTTEQTLARWARLLRRPDEGPAARWRRRWWPASLSQG